MCKCLYIITLNIHRYCMGCVFGSTNCWMWRTYSYYHYKCVYFDTSCPTSWVKSAIHATSIYMCWFFLLLLTQYKTQFVESIQFIAIENRLHRPVVSIKRHTCYGKYMHGLLTKEQQYNWGHVCSGKRKWWHGRYWAIPHTCVAHTSTCTSTSSFHLYWTLYFQFHSFSAYIIMLMVNALLKPFATSPLREYLIQFCIC